MMSRFACTNGTHLLMTAGTDEVELPDPALSDASGNTVVTLARSQGNQPLADRFLAM
jgi:hypothetical protein